MSDLAQKTDLEIAAELDELMELDAVSAESEQRNELISEATYRLARANKGSFAEHELEATVLRLSHAVNQKRAGIQ